MSRHLKAMARCQGVTDEDGAGSIYQDVVSKR